MMEISSDVIRGYNDTMILFILEKEPSYGYEISKQIKAELEGFADRSETERLIDVLRHDRWCFFLQVVGVNSIAIYMLRRIVGYRQISRFLFGGVASWFPSPDFVEALGIVVLCWLTCWFLNRHRLYLKV